MVDEEAPEKPQPKLKNGKKYCSWCLGDGKWEEIKHKSFLCKDHYKEYRNERERIRISEKRRGIITYTDSSGKKHKVKVKVAPEHETRLGTTNFGSSIRRNPDGTPNFDKEQEVVARQLEIVLKRKTQGYQALKRQEQWGEKAKPLPETRELNWDGFAIDESGDKTELIRYDKIKGTPEGQSSDAERTVISTEDDKPVRKKSKKKK